MTFPGAVVRATALVTALGLIGAPPYAQEHADPETGAEETHAAHGGQEPHEAHGEELHHRNALGVLVGGTYESEEDDTLFTWGVEYERLLTPRFALIVGVEHISEIDAWVFAAPFAYRHRSGWRLLAGPGLELKTRRPEREREPERGPELPGDIVDRLPRKQENLFLWRFGVGYNVHVGERWTIAPIVDLDLVREEGHWVEALVFTVSIGFDF